MTCRTAPAMTSPIPALATPEGRKKVVALLHQSLLDMNLTAAQKIVAAAPELLLEKGGHQIGGISSDMRPIDAAILVGAYQFMAPAHQAGWNPSQSLHLPNGASTTPLIYAARIQNPALCAALLDLGADPNGDVTGHHIGTSVVRSMITALGDVARPPSVDLAPLTMLNLLVARGARFGLAASGSFRGCSAYRLSNRLPIVSIVQADWTDSATPVLVGMLKTVLKAGADPGEVCHKSHLTAWQVAVQSVAQTVNPAPLIALINATEAPPANLVQMCAVASIGPDVLANIQQAVFLSVARGASNSAAHGESLTASEDSQRPAVQSPPRRRSLGL